MEHRILSVSETCDVGIPTSVPKERFPLTFISIVPFGETRTDEIRDVTRDAAKESDEPSRASVICERADCSVRGKMAVEVDACDCVIEIGTMEQEHQDVPVKKIVSKILSTSQSFDFFK